MKTTRSKKLALMGIVLTFLFLIPSWAAAQMLLTPADSPYAGMVVFGDSLSDPGESLH